MFILDLFFTRLYNSKTLEQIKRKNLILDNIRELNRELCTGSPTLYT